jgi:hypothetical protein
LSEGGRYRRLYANEWLDPTFRRLDDSARLVRLYVTAGTQTTSVGCFRLSTAIAVEELGGTADDFDRRLVSVCEVYGWDWDVVARVIWINDWFDRNPPANPNVVSSWAKLMKNVPNCDVKKHAIVSIGDSLKKLSISYREPWTELLKSFSKAESQPETIQGSGNSESREQGNRRAPRGSASSYRQGDARAPNPIDERLGWLVRETSKIVDLKISNEELLDSFRHTARAKGVDPRDFTESQIVDAFEVERKAVGRSSFTSVAHLARVVSQ